MRSCSSKDFGSGLQSSGALIMRRYQEKSKHSLNEFIGLDWSLTSSKKSLSNWIFSVSTRTSLPLIIRSTTSRGFMGNSQGW